MVVFRNLKRSDVIWKHRGNYISGNKMQYDGRILQYNADGNNQL
jgi:hypothetical protein